MISPDILALIQSCAGYKNKSVLADLYSQATGESVHEMGAAYQAEGNYQIMSGNPVMMKEGEPANLTVYDERVESYSELDQEQSKVLMKIERREDCL